MYLWICNETSPVEYVKRACEGTKIRWKEGPAQKSSEGVGLYIHIEDLEIAAEAMKPACLDFHLCQPDGSHDDNPLVHVTGRLEKEPSAEEMCFTFIVDAKLAADRIDWSQPDAMERYLEEVSPDDLKTDFYKE